MYLSRCYTATSLYLIRVSLPCRLLTSLSLNTLYTIPLLPLGSPAYGFTHGLGQIFSATPYLVVIPIICFVLIPFFRALNVASSYVYLEFRFNRTIRVLACLLFLLRVIVYLSVVLLAPAVALSAVTGIPQWTVLLVCGVAATLYTLKGGMVRAGW